MNSTESKPQARQFVIALLLFLLIEQVRKDTFEFLDPLLMGSLLVATEFLEISPLFFQDSLEFLVVEDHGIHAGIALLFVGDLRLDKLDSFDLCSDDPEHFIIVLQANLIL